MDLAHFCIIVITTQNDGRHTATIQSNQAPPEKIRLEELPAALRTLADSIQSSPAVKRTPRRPNATPPRA